ncbi:MAG: hypothetical protein ACLVLD_03810 [Hungatella sp.]
MEYREHLTRRQWILRFFFWHQGQYHMLYTGFDGISYQSALAFSSDLIHWTLKVW